MRLRSKLFAVTAGVGLVPIVVATMVGRITVERRARREHSQQLEDAERRVRARLGLLRRQVERAAASLADAEDQFIGRLLIAQARGGVDDAISRQLPLTTPRVMRERGLDLLLVLDGGRRVVASGHFPGRIGDEVVPGVVGHDGEVRLAYARVLEGGRPSTRLTVQAWRRARSPLGGTLMVMAGRYVDLEQLGLGPHTRLQLRDAAGELLFGSPSGRPPPAAKRVVPLTDVEGRLLAQITLTVPDDQLRATLRLINLAALGLVGGAMALALLLALLARRITRPLEQVASGAAAVAAGDLERRIESRHGGEVGHLVHAFNQMTANLKESRDRLQAAERVAAWREIARAIAHELKNPLSPIQTAIETLRKVYERRHPSFDEVFEESTSTILEEVQRLKRIVSEFSGFAQMPRPQLALFDPTEWMRSTVALYQREKIPLQLKLQTPLPPIMADRAQLTQVLVNLLNNGQDALANTASPRLEIELRCVDQMLLLQLRDNGPGFGADIAGKLFTPYFTTKASHGGTGLGLAICQRIVLEHGGSLEASAMPGQGATFVVRLPIAGPQPAVAAALPG